MIKTTRVNIKGNNYNVELVDENFVSGIIVADGEENFEKKTIKINTSTDDIDRVITHELLHAYLDECGLTKYSVDETLVEWLALTFNQILRTRNEIKSKIKYDNEAKNE